MFSVFSRFLNLSLNPSEQKMWLLFFWESLSEVSNRFGPIMFTGRKDPPQRLKKTSKAFCDSMPSGSFVEGRLGNLLRF